jgi:hypothetical protein
MPGYGASESLNAIISAFREDDELDIDDSICTKGVYWINGKLVPVGLEEYLLAADYSHLLSDKDYIEQAKESIAFIEELVKQFRPGIISTSLKIGVVAPFGFALKQYTNDVIWIPSIFAYGWPRTGKTTMVVIPYSLYFAYMSKSHKRPYSSVNTEARLANFLRLDTLMR